MDDELMVRAGLQGGMRFAVETSSGHHVLLDASPGVGGEGAGPTPMELLLGALAGCSGISVLSVLRKQRQEVSAYEVRVKGWRTNEYPKEFVVIEIEHIVTGRNISVQALERAIELSEERYCAVSAMLSEAAEISSTYQIIEEEGASGETRASS